MKQTTATKRASDVMALENIRARLERAKRAYDAAPDAEGVDWMSIFNALRDAGWLLSELATRRAADIHRQP